MSVSVVRKYSVGLVAGASVGALFTTVILTAPYSIPLLASYGGAAANFAILLEEVIKFAILGNSSLALIGTGALWTASGTLAGFTIDWATQAAMAWNEAMKIVWKAFSDEHFEKLHKQEVDAAIDKLAKLLNTPGKQKFALAELSKLSYSMDGEQHQVGDALSQGQLESESIHEQLEIILSQHSDHTRILRQLSNVQVTKDGKRVSLSEALHPDYTQERARPPASHGVLNGVTNQNASPKVSKDGPSAAPTFDPEAFAKAGKLLKKTPSDEKKSAVSPQGGNSGNRPVISPAELSGANLTHVNESDINALRRPPEVPTQGRGAVFHAIASGGFSLRAVDEAEKNQLGKDIKENGAKHEPTSMISMLANAFVNRRGALKDEDPDSSDEDDDENDWTP